MIRPKYGWSQFTNLVKQRITDADEITRDHLCSWERQLHNRLSDGAEEYEDSSYKRDFLDLHEELAQENLDRAGWAYIIWVKASALLESEDCSPDTKQFAKHLVDAALSTAHRAFGAYCQDTETLLLACAGLDL